MRSFVVERRTLPSRRIAAAPDDIAELRRLADLVRDMPRDWIESWPDLFNAMRRVGGKMAAIADRIEVVEAPPRANPAAALSARSPRRERASTITTSKGRTVRVVRKASSTQLELRI